MVQTRSSRAPEPLEVLETPPKRIRKTQNSPVRKFRIEKSRPQKKYSKLPPSALQVVAYMLPQKYGHIYRDASTQSHENDFLTKLVDSVQPAQSSSKRRRDEVDLDNEEPVAKRRENKTPQPSKEHIFMFPRLDEEDDERSMSAPPKTFAASIRRNRYQRRATKQSNRLGVTPRRNLVRLDGDDPFGFLPFERSQLPPHPLQLIGDESAQESTPPDNSTNATNSTTDLILREERSPAPEPETPRRGLFGSLRNIGTATFDFAKSAVTHFTPRREGTTPPQTQDTTPERRLQTTAPPDSGNVQYPAIENIHDNAQVIHHRTHDQAKPKTSVEAEDQELDEDTRKRRDFVARYGRPDSRYDHLHTTPVDGDPDNLAYPLPSSTQHSSTPQTDTQLRSRKRRQRFVGQNQQEVTPKTAPLFGPNSHYARGTMNPIYAAMARGEEHPWLGTKRKYDDTDLQNAEGESGRRRSKTFQPYIEEDENDYEIEQAQEENDVATPLSKKQKLTQTETPRSALKKIEPNSLGRSNGKSVAFNANPVTGIRKISAIYGGYGRPGHYTGGIFSTPTDNRSPDSVSDPGSVDISPTTKANTFVNSGLHPGDKLSQSIKDAMPSPQKEKVVFQWNNPDDPAWRPTLGNPRPGTFRVPYDLDPEEEEELDRQLKGDDDEADAVPEQPSTPKISHAELPKNTADDSEREKAQLEKARLAAEKYKPRSHSRLSNIAAQRSRSPSPPPEDVENGVPAIVVDNAESPDSSVETPDGSFEAPMWTPNPETGEYTCSSSGFPDFLANDRDELVPSFCLRDRRNEYNNTIRGPDSMTEKERQNFYAKKYDGMFKFDAPQTYEEAGTGTKMIHDLIRKFENENPDAVKRAQENMKREWDAHQKAIEDAQAKGMTLVPVYPDRIGEDLMDDDE